MYYIKRYIKGGKGDEKITNSLFAFGSFSVHAGCLPMYKDFIRSGTIDAAAGMLLIAPGIYNSYVVHQARKMRDLIKEAKQSRVGKRTKGLMKSLNGLMSSKQIHRKVLKGNRKGKFCKWVPDPQSRLGKSLQVVIYRKYKETLRLKIDLDRVNNKQNPIWNDLDDLVQR